MLARSNGQDRAVLIDDIEVPHAIHSKADFNSGETSALFDPQANGSVVIQDNAVDPAAKLLRKDLSDRLAGFAVSGLQLRLGGFEPLVETVVVVSGGKMKAKGLGSGLRSPCPS